MTRGFGLIEIIVAMALLVISLAGLVSASRIAFGLVSQSTFDTKASFLAEEGLEALRSLRDQGWQGNIAPLAPGTFFYPVFTSLTKSWTLQTADPGPIDGIFTRRIIVEEVWRRNSDDDIVPASSPDPKTIDPHTRKIVVNVSWNAKGGIKTQTLETLLGNIFQN